MQKSSPIIKVAASLFIIGGLTNIGITILSLATQTNEVTMQAVASQIIDIATLLTSAVSILIGVFLIKQKKWAYVLGIIMTLGSIAINLITLVAIGGARFINMGISILILILLIIGKKAISPQKA